MRKVRRLLKENWIPIVVGILLTKWAVDYAYRVRGYDAIGSEWLVEIDYTIKSIELEDGYAQEEVLKDFKTGLAKYYKTVNSEGEVKYNWVHSVLTNTPGVDDFEELLMNGGISNIKIKLDQYPSTKSVMVKEGS